LGVIEGVTTNLELPPFQIINGLPADGYTRLKSGDKVEIRPPATVGELASLMDLDLHQVAVMVDDAPAQWKTPLTASSIITIATDTEQQPPGSHGLIAVTVNGRSLSLETDKAALMYALAQAEINYTEARGNLMITVNGREAEYSSILAPGDRVEVFWAPADTP